MDNMTFGITMTIVGMGATLIILWILSSMMVVLKKIFPIQKEQGPEKAGEKGGTK